MYWRRIVTLALVTLAIIAGFDHFASPPAHSDAVAELLKRERQVSAGPTSDKLLDPEQRRGDVSGVAPGDSTNEANVTVPSVELGKEKQAEIWDLEHITFELEWKFGKKMKEALKRRDKTMLAERFQRELDASVPAPENRDVEEGIGWYRISLEPVVDAARISAEELAESLIGVIADWKSVEKVGLRVLAIDKDVEVEDLYKLTVLLTATGTGDGDGLVSMESIHHVNAVFANDEQIETGRIVTSWNVDSVEIRGSQEALMKESTKQFQLDDLELPDNWTYEPGSKIDSYTLQTAVDDYDQDGYLDIAISTIQGRQYLLHSVEGKYFEDVTERMGLPASRFFSYTTIATWIDYDNDGFPDLLLGKNLYRNIAGDKFQQVTQTAGLKFHTATMGANVADYDCDGLLDLYVLNHMGDRGDHQIGFVGDDRFTGAENQLWRNQGNGTFQDVTETAGVGGLARHSFAAAWFFANDDHLPDLYLVNDFGRNCLYLNAGDGRFVDITDEAGVGDFANSMGVATGDLDNDGTSEIYVANMFSKMGRRIIAHVSAEDYPEGIYEGIQGACAGSHLYRRPGTEQSYQEISAEKKVNQIGWAYAPVFADFDADGLLDIYATSGYISVDRRKPDG